MLSQMKAADEKAANQNKKGKRGVLAHKAFPIDNMECIEDMEAFDQRLSNFDASGEQNVTNRTRQ